MYFTVDAWSAFSDNAMQNIKLTGDTPLIQVETRIIM